MPESVGLDSDGLTGRIVVPMHQHVMDLAEILPTTHTILGSPVSTFLLMLLQLRGVSETTDVTNLNFLADFEVG